MVRSLALPLAVVCVLHGYGLVGVALSALTGEVLGLFTSVFLLQGKTKVLDFRFIRRNILLMLVLVATVGIVSEKYVAGTGPLMELMVGMCVAAIIAFVLLRLSPELYGVIHAALGKSKSRPYSGKD